MYDPLTTRYTFACPARGETSVRLSAFREVERLPGAARPAVFRVRFACGCGQEHLGRVPHDQLDSELVDLAIRRIKTGEWPWSFFCYREERPRPVFPSFFRLTGDSTQTLDKFRACLYSSDFDACRLQLGQSSTRRQRSRSRSSRSRTSRSRPTCGR
jgi:hypothetical protein